MSIIDTIMSSKVEKRSPKSIAAGAAELRCDPDYLSAVILVEAAGKGMDDSGQVKVLFEKHKFYKNLPAAKRAEAVRLGLARKVWISPKNGGYKDQPNNDAALDFLTRAIAFDEVAGLKSASYGAGQVLGENFGMCGFPTPQAFVEAMCDSEDAQIAAMVDFIKSAGLDDEVRAKDTRGFTRGYNGKGQVDAYSAKIDAAYKRISGKAAVVEDKVRAAGLRLGSTGHRVEALQKQLVEKGYAVAVDGDFGTATRRGVMALQGEHGLKVDGIVGPATQAALDAMESVISDERANATVADLKAKGDPVVTTSDNLAQGLKVAGTVVGVGTIAEETGALDAVATLAAKAETLQGVVAPIGELINAVAANWYVFVAAGLIAAYFVVRHIRERRVAEHRMGLAV